MCHNVLCLDASNLNSGDGMGLLQKLFCCEPKPPRLVFSVRVSELGDAAVVKTPQHKKWPLLGETDMAVSLTDSQFSVLSVSAVKDKKGNPAKLTDPVWTTDNSDVLSLKASDDGMSCEVSATGQLGTAKVQFSADGDIGPGVSAVIGTVDFEVVAGNATVVEITAGPAQEIPDAPPPAPQNP